jgi:hypothetical protein
VGQTSPSPKEASSLLCLSIFLLLFFNPTPSSSTQHLSILANPRFFTTSTLTTRYNQLIDAGIDSTFVSISWADLKPTSSGPVVLDELTLDLEAGTSLGLKNYLLITTINTNHLSLPGHLLDGSNPDLFAAGLNFSSPEVINDFFTVLEAVVPLLLSHNGIFISIANEIDGYLIPYPEQQPFFQIFFEQCYAKYE